MSKQKNDAKQPARRFPVPQFFRTMSIRSQLMLFLGSISLFLLLLIFVLCANLLQPRYNAYLYHKLEARLDFIVAQMDTAIANGEELSSREIWQLKRNTEFWFALNQSLSDNHLSLSGCCVDVSDSTLRYVNYAENVYPCLVHETTGSTFGNSNDFEAQRDAPTVIRLRRECFEKGEYYHILYTASGTGQMVVGRLTSDQQYCVLISTSVVQVAEAGTVLMEFLPVIAILAFLLSMAGAWLFSRWLTRPLINLSHAANEIVRGNYNVTVPVARHDELGLLSEDFNHMTAEVRRSAQLQRDLLANVSHDLRTPLTLIKGYAETVRDLTGEDKPRRDEQLNIIIDETDRLSALVNSVMELSKVSSGTEKCNFVRFDVAQLCDEVAERYTAVCAQNGWTLKLEIPADTTLSVWADPGMIERALHNLLGNAMHHIGEDGIFILRAAPEGEKAVRIEVEDHGPGIREEDLPHLFDRYYRSRSDAGKAGTGLGLSITKAIFQQHGARFGVESAPEKGSTFWFILRDEKPEPQ